MSNLNLKLKPVLAYLNMQLFQQLLLVMLFSGLLSIAFLDNERFYLAWFAFVPLLFAIDQVSLVRTYFLGLIAGLSLYISGTYWIADFINIAKESNHNSNFWLAFLYWFYCAQQVALLLLLLNWLRQNTRIHDFLLFPVVVSAITSAFPMLFSMRLGESQINFYSALQATEFLGVHALDAIMALFNVIIFRFLLQKLPRKIEPKNNAESTIGADYHNNSVQEKASKWPWLIAISMITLWFVYGFFSYSEWDQKLASWERLKVGLVQPNEVPQLGKKTPYGGYSYSYPPEIEMTKRLASIGAELIIWPEAHPKNYLDNPKVRAAYQKNIKKFSASLLFQDLRNITEPVSGKVLTRYNSAIMLGDKGHEVGLYNKIKRIPFGEYIPILNDGSNLKAWTADFLGDFLNQYSMGDEHQLFRHEKINVIPLICYETTFPDFVGNAVGQTRQKADLSKGTILVGLSNDGWFGSTHQPFQHVMASVLRAVENRLPLIHVANNGPSIVVTPHGKVIFTSDFQRAGGYITDVPHSNTAQGSFYSRHPRLFVNFLYGLVILMVFNGLIRRIQR